MCHLRETFKWKNYFDTWPQRVQSTWFCVSGPVVKQHIMVVEIMVGEMCDQKAGVRWRLGTSDSSQEHAHVDLLLPART